VEFDAARAILRGPNLFPPFEPRGEGERLAQAGLPPGETLLVFSRGDQSRALMVTQMAYHHVARGRLAGEPYVVTF
jgi:hypothetical protein